MSAETTSKELEPNYRYDSWQLRAGSQEDFRAALEAAAKESGYCLRFVIAMSDEHVHVVYEDARWDIDSLVMLVAKRVVPMRSRVTADSAGKMFHESLALIKANHRLHTENAALKRRVASLRWLVGAYLAVTMVFVAFALWKSVGQ